MKDGNLRDLEKIQEIIEREEGSEATLNDVVARVLAFYRRYVPYNYRGRTERLNGGEEDGS